MITKIYVSKFGPLFPLGMVLVFVVITLLALAQGSKPVNMSTDEIPQDSSLIDCANISKQLPQAYIIYDTSQNSCGLVSLLDSQKVISNVLGRGENEITWIVNGKARATHKGQFIQERGLLND